MKIEEKIQYEKFTYVQMYIVHVNAEFNFLWGIKATFFTTTNSQTQG